MRFKSNGESHGTRFARFGDMNQEVSGLNHTQPHILLAEDDPDDQFLFRRAVGKLKISVRLTIVSDGEELMIYLFKNVRKLPDILFLDINMPKKKGSECLTEIKQNDELKELPVVIYSTAIPHGSEELLYNDGAHYYVRKTEVAEIQRIIEYVVNQLLENTFVRSTRETFILTLA